MDIKVSNLSPQWAMLSNITVVSWASIGLSYYDSIYYIPRTFHSINPYLLNLKIIHQLLLAYDHSRLTLLQFVTVLSSKIGLAWKINTRNGEGCLLTFPKILVRTCDLYNYRLFRYYYKNTKMICLRSSSIITSFKAADCLIWLFEPKTMLFWIIFLALKSYNDVMKDGEACVCLPGLLCCRFQS